MTKYQEYFNRAIKLDKAHDAITVEAVTGEEYPTNSSFRIAQKAIKDEHEKAYCAALKAHPRWYGALLRGASTSECLKIWRAEGGTNYLNDLAE